MLPLILAELGQRHKREGQKKETAEDREAMCKRLEVSNPAVCLQF